MLSVAIITHNEEENIRDALESVKWADEIVVVDSQSDDRTVEICKEYTDKVFTSEWLGYAAQKNKAVSLTTQPWVLVLDADERVTDDLKSEILKTVNDLSSKDGYYIARKNHFAGRWIRHGGWWPDYTLRLFRRGKGAFQQREVHESIKVEGKTGYLKNPLEHFTYKDTADYLKRMEKYSTLAAKELHKEGRRSCVLDLILRPAATFLRMFFLQAGFLDGAYGLKLASLYSRYTFNKYSKLRGMKQ
jgi:glycosyltransferase involved in cell wall biosynthesis